MHMQFSIGTRGDFTSRQLWDMHALRARVFHDRLGWDVAVEAGIEFDDYDAAGAHYMLMYAGGMLRGCWRLLPTLGPYMLKDTFAQLLDGASAPRAEQVWELSRFAVLTEDASGYGFSGMTLQAIRAIIDHGQQQGWERYVTVTTIAIERLLRRAGVVISRMGAPRQVGVARAVALSIDIDASVQALAVATGAPYLGAGKHGMLYAL